MNILYLVPHVPNPTKARSYFHIRGLLDAGHRVTVATLQRGANDAKHLARLQQMGCSVLYASLTRPHSLRNSLVALLTGKPLQAKFMWSDILWNQITRLLEVDPPDIIHVEHLRMAEYGLRLTSTWPVVWDAVDHLTSLYEQAATVSNSRLWRLIAKLEAPRLRQYEQWLTGQFPMTLVISQRDQALFQEGNPFANRIHVAAPGLPMQSVNLGLQRSPNTLLITGALDYHPNVASVQYFVRDIFPLILRQQPNIKLQLVGANPTPEVQALRGSQIEVTGFVPSLTEYLQRATIALAPILYGSGVQNKVIEAFLTQTPLVATTTALRGLDVTPGEQVQVADTASDFAQMVVSLFADQEKREQIAAAGRRYVEQHHDLVKTTAALVGLYQQLRS